MKVLASAALAAAFAFVAPLSEASVITSAYTRTGGNSWLANFTVFNDGTPATFAGFTIDFPNATNLVLRSAPSTWDSIVVQPDAAASDPGFLDSFAIAASSYLTAGQSQGGFQVSFNYLAGEIPGALPFVINSATFAPLFRGNTTVLAVPEPATALLMALGLTALGLRSARPRSARNERTDQGVAA